MTIIEPMVSKFREVPVELENAKVKIAIEQEMMTPSRGFIAEACKYAHEKKRSLDVLISSNNDTNTFNDSEIKIMEDDLFQCQELGVDGVIIGAHKIDLEAMETLMAAAGGMQLYFSPAFDHIIEKDWTDALNWIDNNNFAGVVASTRLDHLNEKMKNYQNLQLIPFTETKDELEKLQSSIKPTIIINKK
ncbi:copper homeostasis protein CutC [Fructilactobacillus fructivorans]|uniref:Copper homeostasis protein cutC homolog n=1 Tax=Fructilactobacillus fructivorans TaxID=1614 RepID=A0A0C1M545_9LACO|nr:copper homeostasis protein CutC [Fructilactobacillus fructivorans]KID41314.1 Cytoplasmic copper homeostasis protein cutC [Fructilactobacillus fructivorans]